MAGRYKVTGQFFSSSDFKSFVFVPQTGAPGTRRKTQKQYETDGCKRASVRFALPLRTFLVKDLFLRLVQTGREAALAGAVLFGGSLVLLDVFG